MTIMKEEIQTNSHHCFNALAGYLQNMLKSKDFVIKVFKTELGRKNDLIEELLARQDDLERKLSRVEQALSGNEKLAVPVGFGKLSKSSLTGRPYTDGGSKSANFALVEDKIVTVEKTDSLISAEDTLADLDLPPYKELTDEEEKEVLKVAL